MREGNVDSENGIGKIVFGVKRAPNFIFVYGF